MFVFALVLSLGIGVALGLLGGGGSILTIPILRYVLGLEAHKAIAVSLFVVATTSVAALIPHALKGRVRWKVGAAFGAAGMLGAYAGGRVAHFLPETLLLGGFAVVMFAAAIAMLRGRKEPPAEPSSPERGIFLKVLAQGLLVGSVTGLVGAGGGFLVVPALVLLGGLPMEAAVGTSLFVIALQSTAGFAGHLGQTEIEWRTALLVAAAAVVGALAGSAFSSRVRPEKLRRFFAWFVIAMAVFLIAQEASRFL